MRSNKLDWNKEKEKIESLVKQNVNVRAIAIQYGVTFQRLYMVCEELGIDIQYYKKLRDAQRIEARIKAKEEAQRIRKEQHRDWYLSYWADLHGRKPRKKKYHNQPTEGVKESILEARRRTQEYNKKNRLKLLCRRVCNHAIEMGWIIKGVCSECGCLDRVEAHHKDYYKPFQITWVCKSHHHELYHSGKNWHKPIDERKKAPVSNQ